MKKIYGTMAAIMVLTAVLFGAGIPSASASPPVERHTSNGNQCAGGTLVVNITYYVTTDADTAVWGYSWADDSYNKHIQVWEMSPGIFCVMADYNGQFVTYEGQSPQVPTLPLAGGITGTMHGGYTGSFTGALIDPSNPLAFGNLPNQVGCDRSGNCESAFDWLGAYFTGGNDFDMSAWSWTYEAGPNGTWVNANTGNIGNITN